MWGRADSSELFTAMASICSNCPTHCWPCRETSAYGEERPLKECDISERVIKVAVIVASVCSTVLLSTNLEGKPLLSISLISIAAIVTSIRESHSWNAGGYIRARSSQVFFVALGEMQTDDLDRAARSDR